MRQRGHRKAGIQEGAWFNISSGARLTCVPGYAGYVASKHAEIGLTKNAAPDFAERGVRVNVACPGPMAVHHSVFGQSGVRVRRWVSTSQAWPVRSS